jgi:hypothetical protein|tara:strand:+ start:1932 stop:2111 length:180 start_codon:yes stop_codon:yes gene_type:complete
MKKKIIPYIIIIISFILFAVNVYQLDFNNLNQNSFYGIISNIFLIVLGIYLIYQSKKNG